MNSIQTHAFQRIDFPASENYARSASAKWSVSEKQAARTPGVKEKSAQTTEKPPYFDISKLSEEEKEKLEAELKKLNDSIVSYGKLLRFKYNEEAETTYVEVVDTSTNEVVASLPPEFLIDLSIKMKELIGMFIDKKL
jgi:Uncharacterized flagellar protein FlaG